MLKSCLIHTKLCLKVGNWPFRAFLPWSVPSHSMPVTPPYARSDGLSCDEGELCWNEASGVGVGLRGASTRTIFKWLPNRRRMSSRIGDNDHSPEAKPSLTAWAPASASATCRAPGIDLARKACSPPLQRFEHQLALVIHVVQLTDTRAQKVSYQGSITINKETQSMAG